MHDIKLYERMSAKNPFRIHLFEDKPYRFLTHWHEHIELHCILRGEFTVKCGEEKIHLLAGDSVVINGNELHGGDGGSGAYVCLLIPPSFLEDENTVFCRKLHDPTVTQLAEAIAARRALVSQAERLEARGYASLLLSHLVKHYALHSEEEAVYSQKRLCLAKIEPALQYVNANFSKTMSTASLAELVHLSEGYFCQIFKEATGKSAMRYLHEIRIEKAEEMLRSTTATVGEIADCCGFADVNYFSRTFKKIRGITPSSLREQSISPLGGTIK